MQLTPWETVFTILAVAAGAVLSRFLPFWLFPKSRQIPPVVAYLGNTLPAAMMGLLVVYCLKGVSIVNPPHGLPELIAIVVTAALHLWKKNALLSIGAGTALYMLLTRLVF